MADHFRAEENGTAAICRQLVAGNSADSAAAVAFASPARVDVVCLDKTGTLTYGDIRFDRLELCPGADDSNVRAALGLLTRAGDANATAAALSAEFPATSWRQIAAVPFSSARKWSAISVDRHGNW